MYRPGLRVSVCCCFNCCSWAGVMVTRKCACVVSYVVQVINLKTEELAWRGWLALPQPYKLIAGCRSRLTNVLLPARMCATEQAQCILSADAPTRKKLRVLNSGRWLGYYSSNLEVLSVPFSFPQWGARQSLKFCFFFCFVSDVAEVVIIHKTN
jgi:hypothetical protein